MTPEQYAESLIEGHEKIILKKEYHVSGFVIEKFAIEESISDVQHTIEAFQKVLEMPSTKEDAHYRDATLNHQISYYQQALTYLNSKLK